MAKPTTRPQLSDPLIPAPATAPSPTPTPPPHYAYPAAVPVSGDPVPPPYVLLPAYPVLDLRRLRRRRHHCHCHCCFPLISLLLILLAAAAAAFFFLWPAGPTVAVASLHLDHLEIAPPPIAVFRLSLHLRLRLRNPSSLFWLSYHSVSSSLSYRGRPLAAAAAAPGAGVLEPHATAFAVADLWIDGDKVLDDAFYLIGDLAAGSVPLHAVAEVAGAVRVFSHFEIPVKGRISCLFNVNPGNQKIISQDCYPEVNKFYNLVTSFYEYGWGESSHFASRWNGESLRESIKREEHFFALQLGLRMGMKVLDVGCGIGGPLREIARFRLSGQRIFRKTLLLLG